MRQQKLYALTIFIVLISMLSAYGMKRTIDEQLVQETEQYNSVHRLICLPPDVQQLIAFSCGTAVTSVSEDNADELKERVKAFFRFKRVCKHFNKTLTSPWIGLEILTKNKMMREANVLLTKLAHKECVGANLVSLYLHEHPEKVSFGYKKYCVIPLSLVHGGADVDTTDKKFSTTLLSKAVHAQDELVVAWLLNHKADPYQKSFDEDELISIQLNKFGLRHISYNNEFVPICFRATTAAIVVLFLEKVDKLTLLNMPAAAWIIAECRHSHYSLEVMKAWLEYDLSARYLGNDNSSIFHTFIMDYYQSPENFTSDTFFKKIELLLKTIPDMVNTKDDCGRTPIDVAQGHMRRGGFMVAINVHEKIMTLFRTYGAKTSKELEAER